MKKLVYVILLLPSMGLSQSWMTPIGIPDPPFGIHESHTMYDGQAGYFDAGAGPYTYYVDNTATNCDDSGNGTSSQPRCTIPMTLTAGDVVEIHGGPYNFGGNDWNIMAAGSADRPIFIRGVDSTNRPIIDDKKVHVTGSYVLVENLEFDDGFLRLGLPGDQFLAARYNELHHSDRGNMLSNSGAEDVVLFKNYIHHNIRVPNDGHGIFVGRFSNRTWILENTVHHASGDGIQFCHGCSDDPPDHTYVGRNTLYKNRENGITLKYASNVIISENIVYGHYPAPANTYWCFEDSSFCGTWTSGSDGTSIILGGDGGPHHVWVLFNEIYDSMKGIRNEETWGGAWLIGNKIYDIGNSAIALEKDGIPVHIIGNTIRNAAYGINQFWRDNFQLFIHNNIFDNIRDEYLNIETRAVADSSQMSHNLFWNNGNPIQMEWGNMNMTFSQTPDFNGFSGGANNLIAEPMFMDTTHNDFRLQASSPGINAGLDILSTHQASFQQTFGANLDLMLDCDRVVRPQGLEWDIGAFEYQKGTFFDREFENTPGAKIEEIYPNPFRHSLKVVYSVPQSGFVSMNLYDRTGKKVKRLYERTLVAGKYELKLEANDLAAGLYLIRLEFDRKYSHSRSLVLLP